jgi:hypothetical protein
MSLLLKVTHIFINHEDTYWLVFKIYRGRIEFRVKVILMKQIYFQIGVMNCP